MELITHTMGWKLGDLIGEPMMVDISDEMPISMEGIRVKVRIDITKPVPTGVFIPLDDNTLKWVSCIPERVFRLCERCGQIRHLRGSCTKATHVIVAETEAQRTDIMQRMNVEYAIAHDTPKYFCPKRKTSQVHFRKSIKVYMKYHHTGWQYAELDHVHTGHQPNMLDADFSSSEFEYSLDDEEIEDIMAGVNVNLNQDNELQANLASLAGVGNGIQGTKGKTSICRYKRITNKMSCLGNR